MTPFSTMFRCSLIILLCRDVAGDLNFYMNETETRRLLGKYLNYGLLFWAESKTKSALHADN